ncbi:MAG TPA: type IV secretion system protein [Candidatus Paceibacterota bacterium]|nr:type IV secretion system protein [Candidatus Paceibacterota bacterium]
MPTSAHADVLGFGSMAIDAIVSFIGNIFLSFSAVITWMGGQLFEYALKFTVFEMGTRLGSGTPFGDTISNLWSLIRDICNLAFIFGFIYVGIRTIIDPDSADTKRFLSRIIVGALLINFSLFFVKAIVDVSNFTSVQIYNSLTTGTGQISETLTSQLGIITIYNAKGGTILPELFASQKSFSFFLLGGIFMLITAFVFFAAALLLVVRFVAIVLIMVASPVLFAATVFPQTEKFASDLWSKLMSYSFFAPLFLLLMLISIKMIDGLKLGISAGAGGSKDGFADVIAAGSNNFSTILNFTVIIFFMIAALMIASSMSGKGGKFAMGIANTARGKVQSIVGRNTVGRASHYLKEKYEHLDAEASKSSWKSLRGAGLKTARFIAAAPAGGDKGVREALHHGEEAKFGGSDSYESVKKYDKERAARQANINKISELQEATDKATGVKLHGIPRLAATSFANDQERIKFERMVAEATIKDFEEMEQGQREAIVAFMTQNQVDGLMKSDKLTDKEKADLGAKRAKHLAELYIDNKQLLSKANADQLDALGQAYLSEEEHAVRLTGSQMDDLKKKLTPTELKLVSDARENALAKLATGTTINTKEKGEPKTLDSSFILSMKPGDMAKLPKKVLKPLATKLPVQVLDKIRADGTLSIGDQKEIREAFMDQYKSVESADSDPTYDWLTTSPYGKQFGVGV